MSAFDQPHEYGYWDGDTYIEGWVEAAQREGVKWYSAPTQGLAVLTGAAEHGPRITNDIAVSLGRIDFGPTQPPSMAESLDWFMAGLDEDRKAFAEELVDCIDRW